MYNLEDCPIGKHKFQHIGFVFFINLMQCCNKMISMSKKFHAGSANKCFVSTLNTTWIFKSENIEKIIMVFCSMPVSANRIQGLLEENTVEHAIEQRRLYVIDLRYLADIECSEGRTLPGPTCLLYVRESGDLVPIAIQLMPEPSPENPVSLI